MRLTFTVTSAGECWCVGGLPDLRRADCPHFHGGKCRDITEDDLK